MSAEFASLLVVNIIGFLTMLVTQIMTARKASAERADAAAERDRQFQQAREDLKLKTAIDDARVERDRKWAVEDRAAAAATARQMTSRIDVAERKANLAYAATNIGEGLADEPPLPVPSRRIAPPKKLAPPADADFGVAELFRPDESST